MTAPGLLLGVAIGWVAGFPSAASLPEAGSPAGIHAPAVGPPTGVAAYRDIALLPDPEGRVVAAAFRFPVGSAQDPIGLEGNAYLLGRVLERVANDRLLATGARAQVSVDAEEFLVTLLSEPGGWRAAIREIEGLLFERALPGGELEAVRSQLLDVLRFEEGSPVRHFERERAFLLLGAAHPGARPLHGTSATVGAVGTSELEAFRAQHLRRAEGSVALTGPVEPHELEAELGGGVRVLPLGGPRERPGIPGAEPGQTGADRTEGPGAGPALAQDTAAVPGEAGVIEAPVEPLPPPPQVLVLESGTTPLRVPSSSAAPPAWSEGDRIIVDVELTSTWIAVAFPFPAGTPPILLDFLGHLALEALNPTPPDPGLYETGVQVQTIRNAPVLVVSASVDPRITSAWENRLVSSMESIALSPPTGSFFELTRRRFRSARLLELALPELRAAWVARRMASGSGAVPDIELEVWRLERGAVAEAAAAAGPPRILLLGPRSMMER